MLAIIKNAMMVKPGPQSLCPLLVISGGQISKGMSVKEPMTFPLLGCIFQLRSLSPAAPPVLVPCCIHTIQSGFVLPFPLILPSLIFDNYLLHTLAYL